MKKKEKMPIMQKIILVILIIIFLGSGLVVVKWYYNTSSTEKKYEKLSEIIISTEKSEEKEEPEKKIINFEELKKINSDVIGWIKIDNTTINYPIVQTTDNEYYLKKDIYKKYDQCGSIFMDYKNNPNFTDKNNVIYGHNIKKGIIFADLINIYNGNLGKDVNIEVSNLEKTMIFKVFSSYEIEPEEYSINTAITEKKFNDFTKTLKQRSKKEFNCEYTETDKILTLSTCNSTGKKRVLVHASLMEIK